MPWSYFYQMKETWHFTVFGKFYSGSRLVISRSLTWIRKHIHGYLGCLLRIWTNWSLARSKRCEYPTLFTTTITRNKQRFFHESFSCLVTCGEAKWVSHVDHRQKLVLRPQRKVAFPSKEDNGRRLWKENVRIVLAFGTHSHPGTFPRGKGTWSLGHHNDFQVVFWVHGPRSPFERLQAFEVSFLRKARC